MTIPATVGILTFNSGKTIRRALESVKDFDDIVLCDGGSTDGTLEIAREYGARVIAQDARFKTPENRLRDYGGVRQQTLEAARYDWFLYIDSDETLSEGLREEIRTVVSSFLEEGSSLVYRVPIGIMLDGRYIKYSSNYPGYQHRFFNRKSNAHFEKPVHEHIVFDSASVAIGTLKNPWYIYTTMNDWIHYLRETANYRPLEIASACEGPFTWHGYIYNTAWWHFRAAIGVLLRAGSNYLRHGFKDSVPVRGELGRAAALLLTVYLVTTCRLKQLFSHKEKSVRKIYYVANARMPSEKAHGIQIAKMCEAFIEAGADITLVVPNRKTDSRSLREYYGLRVDVPIHRIPTLEFARYERFGYFLMLCAFSLSYTLFLLGRTLRGERFILYTVDLDTYSSSALALFPEPLYTEMHGGKPKSFLQKILFKKLSGVITINTYIRDELKKNFPTSRANYIVEPNGVDATAFVASGRTAARTQLGIPTDARVVLYTGT
jgi:glycosyltransferase involved in cell wall biosynthesis